MEETIKELKQPFGLYDIFGYLLPGFFFVTIFIVDFDFSKIIRYFLKNHSLEGIDLAGYNFKYKYFFRFIYHESNSSFGVIPFLVFLIFCYLIGHVMASFSSFLSKHFIKRILKNPSENLFPTVNSENEESKLYKFIRYFKCIPIRFIGNILNLNYKKPLSQNVREKFKNEIDSVFGFEIESKDYYWLTYSYLCTNASWMSKRIQHFVNLSGFARNVTGTFIFYILIRVVFLSWYLGCILDRSVFIILFSYFIISIIMLWTYLRLHKRQALDMFYIFLSLKK
jgi:hypothetical protein